MYTKEQVKESTLKYFNGDELATNVFIDKYALKDKEGNILELNPDMMHIRLAKEVARIEQKYSNSMSEDEIYGLLKDFKYIVPGGSIASSIGNNYRIQTASNCYVIGNPTEDSYGSIMKIDEEQVHIMRRRGGVGHDLSHLRPNNADVTCAAGTSSGIVPFMERYSNSTRETAQNNRRGALLLSIHIKHPDSENFIDAKLESGKITGANISVKIDKKFMDAVKNDEDYIQTFPVSLNINFHTGFNESLFNNEIEYDKLYDLQYKNDEEFKGCYARRIKAKRLWDKIIHNATISAEPGILFIDIIQQESISDCYGNDWKTITSNPCGEIVMNPYSSCILTSLNLYSYINNPFTEKSEFNWKLFKEHCQIGVRFLDDIVDLEIEKIDFVLEKVKSDPESKSTKFREIELWQKIKDKIIQGRRIGLGITGEGDILAVLGIKYGTDEANDFCEKVHKIMAIEVYKSSIQLAKERGSFPIWNREKEMNNPFLKRIEEELKSWEFVDFYSGRRNIACLTVAPNGSLSIMTQTSSGIEPCFEVYYNRRRKVADGPIIDEVGDHWEEYKVFHHKFVEWFIIEYNFKTSDNKNIFEGAIDELSKMSEKDLISLIQKSPYYNATANTIDYLKKVEMQGRIQKWIDHSISVTHNLPKGISEEEVSKIYMKAYEEKCKGITVYVDGSRSGVLIKDKKEKRPESLPCDIYVVKVKGKDWVVLIGLKEERPYEVFAFKQGNLQITHDLKNAQLIKRRLKTGNKYDLIANSHFKLNDISSFFELGEEQSLTRQISLNLRYGVVPVGEIVDQLDKAVGSVVELSKAVSRVLRKYIIEKVNMMCPECGSTDLISESGCIKCKCGWSKC